MKYKPDWPAAQARLTALCHTGRRPPIRKPNGWIPTT